MSRPRARERTSEEKAREAFYRLALDWVQLHLWLPKPARIDGRHSNTREYGHPAQWASDKAAQIADLFGSWHEMVADARNETCPPYGAEMVRVVAAWRYLEPRFGQLVELVEPEALREITDLHYSIKRTLGATNPIQILPMPCPNDECGLRTLQRRVAVGHDFISCGSCDYQIREEYYPLLVRMSLDTLIEAA